MEYGVEGLREEELVYGTLLGIPRIIGFGGLKAVEEKGGGGMHNDRNRDRDGEQD